MKIVHISNSDSGGAGIAALRLHLGMLDQNADSNLLCLKSTSGKPGITVYPKKYLRFYERLFQKIKLPIDVQERQRKELQKVGPFPYEMFSFAQSAYKQVHLHPLVKNADILVIHWVAGFIDFPSFFKDIDQKKKILFYTHDFNLILGGFHTLYDMDKCHNQEALNLNASILEQKIKALQPLKSFHIVANSNYSYNQVQNKGKLKNAILHQIQLGISKTELHSVDKNIAKMALGFPPDDLVLLSAANDVSTPRKGFDRLLKALENLTDQLNHKRKIHVCLLGSHKQLPSIGNVSFRSLGTVWNTDFKSIIFSAADYVLALSREETFGQTVIEAYACKTPAIVWNSGALPEIVVPGKTGHIINNTDDLAQTILEVSEQNLTNEMSQNAYQHYQSNFTTDLQAKRFLDLFEQL